MAVTAGIAAVAGTAVQYKGQKDAASARKESNRVSTAAQKNEDAANLRKQAREARIRQAKIDATAEATGAGGSSAEFGATSALSTQVSANVARVTGQQKTAQGLSNLNQDIADAQVTQALGQGISSIGSQAFSATGGFDNLFKGS